MYGSKVFIRPEGKRAAQKLTEWLQTEHVFEKGDTIVLVSGQYPGLVGGTDTIKVRVLE